MDGCYDFVLVLVFDVFWVFSFHLILAEVLWKGGAAAPQLNSVQFYLPLLSHP